MEKILGPKHTSAAYLLLVSRLFERAGYYGFRSIMVLYLVHSSQFMTQADAISFYSVFTSASLIAYIFGGLIGDLVIGNRWSTFIGALLQAFGIFTFCVPHIYAVYVGIALIMLGGGLYSPNFMGLFGKTYSKNTKLLDSGYSMVQIAVNFGAFAGVLLISLISENGYILAFICSGIFLLISALMTFLTQIPEKSIEQEKLPTTDVRIAIVLGAIFLAALFWLCYEMFGSKQMIIMESFTKLKSLSFPVSFLDSLTTVLGFLMSIPIAIWWTYFYIKPWIKMCIGFLFLSITLLIFLSIPVAASAEHLQLFFIAIFFAGIAEIFISPVSYSLLIRFANPKYYAIFFGLYFIPLRWLPYFMTSLNVHFETTENTQLIIGIITTLVLGAGLFILHLISQKKELDQSTKFL